MLENEEPQGEKMLETGPMTLDLLNELQQKIFAVD